MIESYQDALRQIMSLIDAAWAPTGFIINYPNKVERIPDASTPWARVMIEITKSNQRTISRPGQIYTTSGILIIQVFTPVGTGISSTQTTDLVKLLLDALRGQDTPGGLFFMEVTPQPGKLSGHWFQTNVSSLWQCDERLTT